jgi:Domain of unknown function (DUF4262)
MSEAPYNTAWLKELRKLDMEPNFASTLDNVEKFGWEAMLVNGEQQRASFAYTVGLCDTVNFPEIIVIGLKQKTAHCALECAVERMKSGLDLTAGRFRGIVGEVEVEFRPVEQKWFRHIMCRADWYYGYSESVIPALQLIYPDHEGRFQWEQGFEEYFRQPLLQPDAEWGVAEKDFWATNDPESCLFDWKFTDGPHTQVFLSKTVHEKQEPITYVSHDASDSSWQFLGDLMSEGGGPVVSCLHHPIDDDPTLKELFDLPLGWCASRENSASPWQRFERPPEELGENTPAT